MTVRLAAGLGVLAAFPLLSSGVAQAAMAGAPPLTTTNRPDLRTVHINQTANQAEFCFDKAIANSSPQGGSLNSNAYRFTLGGYRSDILAHGATANVESSNTNCALVTITTRFGTVRDLASYSFGTVADNTVVANAGGAGAQGNIGDSTANLDSNSHNGTADHTQGPDLQAVTPDLTNNRMIYTFDQPVCTSSSCLMQGAGRFLFYDSNGAPHYGSPIGASGASVLVQFASGPDPISAAKVAVVIRGSGGTEGTPQGSNTYCTTLTPGNAATCENGGYPQTINPTESVAVPGTSGLTGRPVLQSAALVPGPSNQIDYTFSLPISAGDASDLVAVTSNGEEAQADSETVISANTVRATFASDSLQNFVETVVKASTYGSTDLNHGAVQSVNPAAGAVTRNNATGGVSVGDNAGAFATGFSSGPDARSVTFDNANGSVVVQFDQRVDPSELQTSDIGCASSYFSPPDTSSNLGGGCWSLLDNTGAVVDPTPSSAAVVNNAPFQSQVRLTYPPGDLQRSTALGIAGFPVDNEQPAVSFESSSCCDISSFGNVRQVLQPTATAAAFADPAKGRVHYRWHYLSKKQQHSAFAKLRKLHRHHSRHHR